VTVHVSAIPVAARPSPTSFEATSDNLGKFVLPARLPPGEYEVTAARPHGGNIFGTFIDLRESKRLVRIGTDLAQMRVDVHLKPR
jgi:hypothetical protein